MATHRGDTDDTSAEVADDADRPGRTELLDSRLVTNPDGPDRRTVFPGDLSSVARMSTWLTANERAFVDVEANR